MKPVDVFPTSNNTRCIHEETCTKIYLKQKGKSNQLNIPIPQHEISKGALTPARSTTPFAWDLRFLPSGPDAVAKAQSRPMTDEILRVHSLSPNWRSHQPQRTKIKTRD